MIAKKLTPLLVGAAFSFLSVCSLAVEPLTARQIMDKVHDINMGDNASSTVTMTVYNEKGDARANEMVSYRKKFGPDKKETRSIMFYTSPHDMKDVGFFSVQFDDGSKPDERWMYTPLIRKLKKVGSKDKRMSFMTSDFSYADMSLQNSDNNTYTLLKEEELNGQKVWVIEGIPTSEDAEDENGYTKSVFYVRQDNFITVRSINTLKKGGKEKQMDVSDIQQIDGIWVLGEITMVTRKADKVLSRTVMKTSNMSFNKPKDDNFYTTRQLERGPE
jgi:hypothetical protein